MSAMSKVTVINKINKIKSRLNKDAGISLPEVLIAVGLSGLLALGCTQLALASFASASYTQKVAVQSLSTGNLNRLVTSDLEKSTGFLVSSGNAAARNVSECSNTVQPGAESIKSLLTTFNTDGSSVGYEVISAGGQVGLWRVVCPTSGQAVGSQQLLAKNLPAPSTSVWDASVMCASFPAGSALVTADCAKDQILNSFATNPGILFTVPANLASGSESHAAQIIVAARNIG